MGAADVVPGVSGGTMALILGIYQRLLEAIRSFDLALVRLLLRAELRQAAAHVDLGFVLLLCSGIFTALMFFTRVVPLPELIRTHPEPIFALFFGLIVASVGVLLRTLGGLGGSNKALLAAGVIVGWLVVSLVPVNTPQAPWFIVLSGALAISALILPGISGSFVLLLMKKYAYIFDALGRLDFAIIVPFGVGAIVGLMAFSRFLVWLLHHHYRPTLSTIIGILIGSLWLIWPFQQRTYEIVRGKTRLISSTPVWPSELSSQVVLALGLILIGLATVIALNVLASRGRGSDSDTVTTR